MPTFQKFPPKTLFLPPFFLSSIPSCSKPVLLSPSNPRLLFTSSADFKTNHLFCSGTCCTKRCQFSARASTSELKHNWLDSLSCPTLEMAGQIGTEVPDLPDRARAEWVVGIDPDISGALAVLKFDESGSSAQVFDTPHLPVLVGKRVRKRLDARSIVQLLRNLELPHGTIAYIEQSRPFPKDGKQGWWSGGFGYGLWIGVLVASGFSVVPVPSLLWKNQFGLCGSSLSKDDSRKAASTLFPSLSPLLKRKKDHGRAEALLIAAYGKGLKIPSESSLDCRASEANVKFRQGTFETT